MSDTPQTPQPSFAELGLPAPLLKALNDVGYETPSPIQAQTIPPLLRARTSWARPRPAPARPRLSPCPSWPAST